MTSTGLLQILRIFPDPAGADQAAGAIHGARVRRRAHVPASGACGRSSAWYTSSAASMNRTSNTGRITPASLLAFSLVGILLTYLIQRLQGMLPFNPQGFGGKLISTRPGVQHRRQFRHQHQLASLHARNHHELLHPDGRAGRAQLHFGGGRHRHRHCAGARIFAPLGQDHRQFLGGYHARHALRAAAALDRWRAAARARRACIQNFRRL